MIKYEGRYAESDIPSSSDEWELFTSTMSCGHAARSLTAAMKRVARAEYAAIAAGAIVHQEQG